MTMRNAASEPPSSYERCNPREPLHPALAFFSNPKTMLCAHIMAGHLQSRRSYLLRHVSGPIHQDASTILRIPSALLIDNTLVQF